MVTGCLTAAGAVIDEIENADGWLRVDLRLDSPRDDLLDQANFTGAQGRLVLLIPCGVAVDETSPPTTDCGATFPAAARPPLRRHIWATGAYAKDLDHGWMELDPLFDWRLQ